MFVYLKSHNEEKKWIFKVYLNILLKLIIQLKYCPTNDMLADLLTKGLSREKFVRLRDMCGITEMSTFKWGVLEQSTFCQTISFIFTSCVFPLWTYDVILQLCIMWSYSWF